MKNRISSLLGGALAFAAFTLSQPAHSAPNYPDHPVTIVVPFSAGSASDTYARLIGPKLGEALGQTVVIENKDGAAGFIGAQYAVRAKPDGHTLLLAPSPWAYTPYFFKKPPYDPLKSFDTVAKIGVAPSVLVASPNAPFKDVAGMAAYAKQNPGKLTYSSAGVGSYSHLIGEAVDKSLGIQMMHVPYKSTGQAMSDVMGDMITLTYASLSPALPHIRAGKLKALGVTSSAPSPIASDIPTLASQGMPGFEAVQWFGIVAPAGTPAEIVQSLNQKINAVLKDGEIAKRFEQMGIQLTPASSAEFTADIEKEIQKWVSLGKELKIAYD